MTEIIKISDLYIGYPEHINNILKTIDSEPYMIKMAENIKNLPPIEVINLCNGIYSLSDGHHRVALYKYNRLTKIEAEVY